MKKMFFMALMVFVGLQAQAQIVSSRSSMTTRQVIEEHKNYTGWSTFGLEYLPSKMVPDHGDSESYNGFAINYTQALSLTQSAPLFFEWGIGAQWSHWSDSEDRYEQSFNFVSMKVPFNLIYDYQLPNSSINIDPYVGLQLRGNVWGEGKEEYYDDSDTWDLFDDDEGECKRFQLGWQIGAKVRFNNSFFVGVAYGSDFSEFAEDTKISEFKLSLGLVF